MIDGAQASGVVDEVLKLMAFEGLSKAESLRRLPIINPSLAVELGLSLDFIRRIAEHAVMIETRHVVPSTSFHWTSP